MLSSANLSPTSVAGLFGNLGVPVGFFSPTATALSKSIIDAHSELRAFFRISGIHDYAEQEQGTENKVILPVRLIGRREHQDERISLYRPSTKSGDPRFWVSRLGTFCKAGDLLALAVSGERELLLYNCSALTEVSPDELNDAIRSTLKTDVTYGWRRLEIRLRDIAKLGYVRSRRDGPTGVGFTLESLLDIAANSSKDPDFEGVEIKGSRVGASGRAQVRRTLFSRTPDWNRSSLSSGLALLNEFGYVKSPSTRRQFYCSVGSTPNSFGIQMGLTSDGLDVGNYCAGRFGANPFVVWSLTDLVNALVQKHSESVWVKAKVKKIGGVEHFHYVSAVHTRAPLIGNLPLLVTRGVIEMDYTLSAKESGQARDHGYLFKISEQNLPLLFPPQDEIDLLSN